MYHMKQGDNFMTQQEKHTAINWLANGNYDISTVAQHFGLTIEELKSEIHNQ